MPSPRTLVVQTIGTLVAVLCSLVFWAIWIYTAYRTYVVTGSFVLALPFLVPLLLVTVCTGAAVMYMRHKWRG